MNKHKALLANLVEISLLGVIALVVIWTGWQWSGDGLLARQAVVWVANVLMLLAIWGGLRRRGQSWSHLGLQRPPRDLRGTSRLLLQSLLVFLAALAGFIVGSIVAAMVMGEQPAGSMGGYQYLQGNLPMLILAWAAVLLVSSFGEEAIYRGFLMTRIAEGFGAGKGAWWLAALVSAIVFGLIHFGWGLFGIIQTTFMGLALAAAYLKLGRQLWALVLAHAYLDTILLLQLYLGAAGGS